MQVASRQDSDSPAPTPPPGKEEGQGCRLTLAIGFHARGCVDGVSKEAVAWHLETHHASTHRPCAEEKGAVILGKPPLARLCLLPPSSLALTGVDANPQVQLLAGPVPDAECLDSLQKGESHAHNLMGMQLPVPDWQARHHHVGVPNGLHLQRVRLWHRLFPAPLAGSPPHCHPHS